MFILAQADVRLTTSKNIQEAINLSKKFETAVRLSFNHPLRQKGSDFDDIKLDVYPNSSRIDKEIELDRLMQA